MAYQSLLFQKIACFFSLLAILILQLL